MSDGLAAVFDERQFAFEQIDELVFVAMRAGFN